MPEAPPDESAPTTPPLDGPLANDDELDRALFGPWDGDNCE